MNDQQTGFSDEELATFIDGQADDALTHKIVAAMDADQTFAARMDAQRTPVRAIVEAFDLNALDAPEMPNLSMSPRFPRLATATAIAASFALGMVMMNIQRPDPNWIDRVASYQALYVAETLAGDAQDTNVTGAVLTQTRDQFGHTLVKAPDLEDMVFKRAQILAIDDRPLIQIAYLANDGTPFALCIVRVDEPDYAAKTQFNHDLAATSWVNDGLGYLLIGGSDAQRVEYLASNLAEQL